MTQQHNWLIPVFSQLGFYKADDWLFGEGAGQPLSLDFQISCMDLHCLTAITLSNNVFAAIASELNSVLLILKALGMLMVEKKK